MPPEPFSLAEIPCLQMYKEPAGLRSCFLAQNLCLVKHDYCYFCSLFFSRHLRRPYIWFPSDLLSEHWSSPDAVQQTNIIWLRLGYEILWWQLSVRLAKTTLKRARLHILCRLSCTHFWFCDLFENVWLKCSHTSLFKGAQQFGNGTAFPAWSTDCKERDDLVQPPSDL